MKSSNDTLQIFDRSKLKVNTITQDEIIKRYNEYKPIEDTLYKFIAWVDSVTYLLDGQRYIDSDMDEPISNMELVKMFNKL